MYKMIKDMPNMGVRSVVLVAALLSGCSDLVTRFDYNKNAVPAYKAERTDVKTTASIAPTPIKQTTAPAPASPYIAVQPNFKSSYKPVRVPLFKSNTTPPQTRTIVQATAKKQPLRSNKAITFAEYRTMKRGKQNPTAKAIPWASWAEPSEVSRPDAPLHTASVIKPTAFNENKNVAVTRVIQPVKLEVKEGQTLYSLARQHNSSVDAIIQANNLDSANIFIGQTLLIPTTSQYSHEQAIKTTAEAVITKAKVSQPIAAVQLHSQVHPRQHIVVESDTLESLAKDYNISWTKLAALNAMEPDNKLKAGTVIKLPHQSQRIPLAAQPATKKTETRNSTANASVTPQSKRSKEEQIFTQSITVKRIDASSATTLIKNQSIMPKNFAQVPQKRKPFRADVTTTASIAAPQLNLPKARTTPQKVALPKENRTLTNTNLNNDTLVKPEQSVSKARISEFGFRWPVQGRIIRSFGSFPGGKFNEGINIAVPEGTNIHAAEGGKVAYAGNEHKQYGQLIVIYHTDNWVTVYAHNKDLNVKEGDQVKRGQIIAKAGATGDVDSPQLHFQIRKSAKAYNPLANLPKS